MPDNLCVQFQHEQRICSSCWLDDQHMCRSDMRSKLTIQQLSRIPFRFHHWRWLRGHCFRSYRKHWQRYLGKIYKNWLIYWMYYDYSLTSYIRARFDSEFTIRELAMVSSVRFSAIPIGTSCSRSETKMIYPADKAIGWINQMLTQRKDVVQFSCVRNRKRDSPWQELFH